MSEEKKRERGVKVLVKRPVWIETEDKPKKVLAGEVVVLSKEQVKQFGNAVTRDLPDGYDE